MQTSVTERTGRLIRIGLRIDANEQALVYKDIYFPFVDIQCMTDEEFDSAVLGALKRLDELDKEKPNG